MHINVKKIIYSVITLIVVLAVVQACVNQQTNQAEQTLVQADTTNADNCIKTITDPNNTKPMALNMRHMAAQADSIKTKLKNGLKIDSLSHPFVPFYLSEPTDPTVLEPKFFDNAKLYRAAYVNLMSTNGDQVQAYNAMIGACINCHQSYCSGPLKRIRKLTL
jgi:cytochrome c553